MEALKQKIDLLTDEEVIRKVLAGEKQLFELLIRRYNTLLYKISRGYGMNHQDAEDLMQETHFAASDRNGINDVLPSDLEAKSKHA